MQHIFPWKQTNTISMASAFGRERRISWKNSALSIHTAAGEFGTVKRKYLWEHSRLSLSISMTIELEMLKLWKKGWQKQKLVHKKNGNRMDITILNSDCIQHITIEYSSRFGVGKNLSLDVCSFHTFLIIISSFYLDLISPNTMLIERFDDITIT